MQEDLIPLDLPPGFVNNGTTYQSKNRWFTGSLVRFFQRAIEPIGGWVKRTTTGATINGVPNAAVAWQTNDGSTFLAIGTTTNLYVVSGANVVFDITPAAGFATGGNPVFWQLDTFGAYLTAVYNGPGTNPAGAVNAFYWTGDTGTPAVQVVASVVEAPFLFFGVVTTPERFLVLLRGSDPLTVGGGSMRTFRAQRAGAIASEMVD